MFIYLKISADIMIDKNTDTCGNSHLVQVGEEYLVKSMGELPGTECSYNFTGEVKNNCMGLCYALQPGSFFKDLKASLKVVLGSQTVVGCCSFFNYFGLVDK